MPGCCKRLLARMLPGLMALLTCGILFAAPSQNESVSAVTRGEQLYARCAGCHSPERNRAGPLHCGLLGRVSGTVEGFNYTDAMRQSAITWNAKTLDAFLENPTGYVPGTAMGVAGISEAEQRQALIAWLSTLSEESPICQPGAPQ